MTGGRQLPDGGISEASRRRGLRQPRGWRSQGLTNYLSLDRTGG